MKLLTLAGSAALLLASCSTGKTATVADLAGEWDITVIGGERQEAKDLPYLGFNAGEGRIYGYAGCNRLTGALDTSAAPGTISFDRLASTRMMCADMSLENETLAMLNKVKGYKFSGNELLLTDAAGNTVGQLQKRCGKMKASALQGEWRILSVQGTAAGNNLEERPVIWFDTKEKLVHGNASCNLFNGSYTPGKGQSLQFSQMLSTMKMCADFTFERKVFEALDKVRSFGMLHNGNAGLFDGNGQLLVELGR